jgi:hypothetical protein
VGFLRYEPCPRCQSAGRDRSGDNLGVYSDGSAHCFAGCGYHIFPKHAERKEEKQDGDEDKAVLPRDFTREVPALGWKWLLQYGLSYSYWRPFVGYSPSDERLILTFSEPPRFSIGRYLGTDGGTKDGRGKWIQRPPRKWKFYGAGHEYVELLGGQNQGPIVLVEDLVSAHKVAQVAPCLCLFGTHVHDVAIKLLLSYNNEVVLWLDADQYTLLQKKVNRLQTLLNRPVRFVSTEKDPKSYETEEIRQRLTPEDGRARSDVDAG